MAILSFQSRVVYGHVGNSVAEFALRRLGVDVWAIDTVCLSNHPGHARPGGAIRSPEEIADLVDGLERVDVLADCEAVLSGYLGSAANGRAILAAVARVRRSRPGALWCCDPVMGDRDTGLYVDEEQVRFFREEALPAAEIVTPNHFELETLIGHAASDLAAVRRAVFELRNRGPRTVLVSSLLLAELGMENIGTLLATADGTWLVTTPRLRSRARGTGDLLAAVFLARLTRGEAAPAAVAGAVAATWGALERTGDDRELHLVDAQAELPHPSQIFPATLLL